VPTDGRSPDALIIRNATLDIRVRDVTSALDSLRIAIARAGGEISEMNVTQGHTGVEPTDDQPAAGPSSALITIRVPAAAVSELERTISRVGTVISQTSSADDVTEEAIDLEARIKNLRAEESRLRGFLERTAKVSELLEVERELARVRGEIESMDAQLTYLEREAALATLTVSLSEPGPLAEPATFTWGLREALTRGIHVAAAMITGLVTVAVPALLLLVLGALVYLPLRVLYRRAASRRHAENARTQPEVDA
jgi:hypothetical protein